MAQKLEQNEKWQVEIYYWYSWKFDNFFYET